MSDTAGSTSSDSGELRAVLAAAAGSICVGFVPFFVTGLQDAGLDTVSVLMFRYLIALVVLVPLALWTTANPRQQWTIAGRWLALNGVTLGAFQTYCYFKAIESLPTSIVITIFYCYPVMALLIDRWVFGLLPRGSTLLALAMVMVGVVMTSLPNATGAMLERTGLMFAALTPVGYAVYIAVAYPFTKRVSTFFGATCIYGSLAIAFGVWAMARGVTLPREPTHWLSLLAVGTLGGAVQIASFSYALPRLSASGYALIVCLELVTVVLVGVALLGEQLVVWQWVGVGLVLVGIVAERWMKGRAQRARR